MSSAQSVSDFHSLSLSADLCAVLAEVGYSRPTLIQAQSIPVLLEGRDLVGQARTGTGKTAAFALPILQAIDLGNRRPQALVMCPTRELSAQVARAFRRLGRKQPELAVLEVAGGQPIKPQERALAAGVHIVVGTPGRILDHLDRGSLSTDTVSKVVVDEADRMLDMGFQPDMEKILAALPDARQTALFSATFPRSIAQLSERFQTDAERVTIEASEPVSRPTENLCLEVAPEDKVRALRWILNEYPHDSALIFCNFKATVAELETELAATGASVDCLHGDLEQFYRDQVLARFRNHSVRLLIATDVAGRGIDVEDLDLVINFELPKQPNVYVHRVGRTGRAGKAGLAISLATSKDESKLGAIANKLGAPLTPITWNKKAERARVQTAPEERSKMGTLLISGGRKDKIRPGDILGALTGEAGGLRGQDIGKIEIQDRLSYVAVSRSLCRQAAKALNAGRIKGKRFRVSIAGRV